MFVTYEERYAEDLSSDQEEIARYVPAKESLTCNWCPDVGTCPFAWDRYNTDGDCLAEK